MTWIEMDWPMSLYKMLKRPVIPLAIGVPFENRMDKVTGVATGNMPSSLKSVSTVAWSSSEAFDMIMAIIVLDQSREALKTTMMCVVV